MTLTDHYFVANFVDIPESRFTTLQGAMLYADEQDAEVTGDITYIEDDATPPHPMVRYTNGVVEDVE